MLDPVISKFFTLLNRNSFDVFEVYSSCYLHEKHVEKNWFVFYSCVDQNEVIN